MKIPKKTTNKWKLLLDRGDVKKISERFDIDPRTVSKALKGEAEEDVFKMVSEFYRERDEILKSA